MKTKKEKSNIKLEMFDEDTGWGYFYSCGNCHRKVKKQNRYCPFCFTQFRKTEKV